MAVTKRKMSRTNQRAPTPGKKDATRPRKAVARKMKRPAVRTARSDRSAAAAAAPLLATSPKKITANVMNAVQPSALNPFAQHDETPGPTPNFDPLALARPWMRLCVQVAVANFALQGHMARTAMYLPQVAAARALR